MAAADVLYVGVVCFALAITFSIVYSLQSQLFPALQTQLNSTASTAVIQDAQAVFPVFDILMVAGFFGSLVAILALAYLLPTTPLTAGVNLVAMMAIFLVTPVLTNSYMEVGAALPNVDVSVVYPYTYFLMENYPLFVMVLGFLLFIVLVARFKNDPNY